MMLSWEESINHLFIHVYTLTDNVYTRTKKQKKQELCIRENITNKIYHFFGAKLKWRLPLKGPWTKGATVPCLILGPGEKKINSVHVFIYMICILHRCNYYLVLIWYNMILLDIIWFCLKLHDIINLHVMDSNTIFSYWPWLKYWELSLIK